VNDYYATLDGVTAEHIREAARRFLTDDRKTVVTMLQAGGA
jgi:hypothetical protein